MTLETRPIPRSGERIPAVGLGTWQAFDVPRDGPERAAAKETLRTLVELGGTVIDSSPMYGAAEQVVGALAPSSGSPASSSSRPRSGPRGATPASGRWRRRSGSSASSGST